MSFYLRILLTYRTDNENDDVPSLPIFTNRQFSKAFIKLLPFPTSERYTLFYPMQVKFLQ